MCYYVARGGGGNSAKVYYGRDVFCALSRYRSVYEKVGEGTREIQRHGRYKVRQALRVIPKQQL